METEVSEATKAVIRQDIQDALSVSSCDDPLLGATFGWLHRMTTNLLHKHGSLVQHLFASILAETPGYEVFKRQDVAISADADRLATRHNIMACLETDLPYEPIGHRSVRPDVVAFNTLTGTLQFIEVKRGVAKLSSATIRSETRDLLCLQMLGRGWARANHLDVQRTEALAVSFYGRSGLPSALTVLGANLDEHFGLHVTEQMEASLAFARDELERRLPDLVDDSSRSWSGARRD